MGKANQAAQAFHTWHSPRTYNPGHPQMDPWMRDVLVNLQACLYTMSKQIDQNTERIDRIERFLSSR